MEKIERVCPVCGKSYKANPVRLRHGRQTTCSRKCSYELRAAVRSNGSQMTCSLCGKQFYRSPAEVKSKHQGIYCSRKCHYAGRGKGLTRRVITKPYVLVSDYDHHAAGLSAWATRRKTGKDRHSEATKERLRQTTIRHISRQATGSHVSKLEDKVAQELTTLGIDFIRQHPVRNPLTGRYIAVVDFLINGSIAMEVNGTFWHADPRFYPDGPIHDSQRRTVTRYARKAAALQGLGIPLIEVWESDLDQGIVDTLRQALHGYAL